jgi:hypothetical protein
MKPWLKITLLACLPVLSHAHTMSPFLLPEVFDTKSSNVTFTSGITVEKFYAPSGNFKTSYVVTNPEGQNTAIEAAASLKRFNIAEFNLDKDGTYRIRTENAKGNPGKYALVDGRWLRVRPARPAAANAQTPPAAPTTRPAAPLTPTPVQQIPRMIAADQVPANATLLETNSHYIAESFVTKNKPSALPKVTNKGFEVQFLTHPNETYAGDSLKAKVLLNGKAVSDLEVDVFKGASSYEPNAKREQPHVKTNKNGEFEVKFDVPGIYLITTSYPEANPDNTKKPHADTYTYSLSVEVTE